MKRVEILNQRVVFDDVFKIEELLGARVESLGLHAALSSQSYSTHSDWGAPSGADEQASHLDATGPDRFFLPNCSSASITSPSSCPCSVRWYSTRGGISRKACRCTNPNSSSPLSRWESVFELICPSDARKALKRMGPCNRFMTISRTHASPKRRMARPKGVVVQVSGVAVGCSWSNVFMR